VIGGGPAGFFAALACAEARPGARIAILEKASTLLNKVRVSGGGRCNLTHSCFEPAALVQFYPRGARELRGAFARFQPSHTVAWFEARGVPLKTEPDGRIFPASDSSETIITCLIGEARRLGVEVRTGAGVASITPGDSAAFTLTLRDGSVLQARNVLIATGGDRAGLELAARMGHNIVAPVPSLFTFNVSDPRLEGLAGISVPEAHCSLPEARLESSGPLLITHWGLSGPAVLRLSAWGARELNQHGYRMRLLVNWLPAYAPESAASVLKEMRATDGRRQISSASGFKSLPLRLWKQLTAGAGIPEGLVWANLSRAQQTDLANQLVRGEYQITGKGQFKDEFVTCGGVELSEVDFRSMVSRKIPGLSFAGEVLDIDGLTGGFNFQNAWTTGWIAGKAVAGQA
jgi:predicted Rossmann fold flavoprotein